MFIQRVNIFLLSLVMTLTPAYVFASVYIPPFPSAAIAADIASALGVGVARGFSAAAVGSGVAAAAVGVGVASFCLASAVQGADSCGAGSSICQALTAIKATSCRPNSDGEYFRKVTGEAVPDPDFYYKNSMNSTRHTSDYAACAAWGDSSVKCGALHHISTTVIPDDTFHHYRVTNGVVGQVNVIIQKYPYSSTDVKPTPLPDERIPASQVGAAVASSPSAAAAAGSAAKAYANALTAAAATGECAGAYGFVNGTETCVKEGLTAAEAAAAAAAANPPLERTCATGFTLDATTKLCSNDGLSKPNTCNAGMVANSSGVCVPADPLNPTQPATGTEKPLPAFCTYASVICEVIEWLKESPEPPTNTNVSVTNKDIAGTSLEGFDISQSRVNFGGSCPAPIPITFSFMGSSQTLSYSFEPFCDFLTQIRPVIIACAYLGGAYIVAGAGRKGDA